MATSQRLPRAQRREQILDAATRVFARAGYAATSVDDVAVEAGITRVLLYRHFDSRTDLYRAVLDRARAHLGDTVGSRDFDDNSIADLVRAAVADPDGFRLLFRHAGREPEFRDVIETMRAASTEIAANALADHVPDGPWRAWAARLVPTLVLEAVLAWLDVGQPDPDTAADRIGRAVHAALDAAQPEPSERPAP
ncbi:TetR family transcriptional regulator [Herbihabitans rhizosphaerae]|uniref:TetR family transcriptional regulator n=1 Tax=Herbihabitans rhizosphaerae TaxID=1872711 RepID=A0A4Q7L5N9_9PSEU|nr:TetR/AcrR family transcriptional regulator [Herbihabitans rhizosphaerae]RZS43582.1 TetR family transcriptional regulator [Herbihabitans rhizosphaerae]